jgi:predicted CXXCH cytochrome family protein
MIFARAKHLRIVLLVCSIASVPAIARAEHREADDPRIAIHEGFAEESKCGSCHADQVAAFAKSNHAKAMAAATEGTVRGDFNDVQFQRDGVQANFFRRDDRYFVRTEGADGKPADFKVTYTFGYEPLQQYLVDIGGGRLQALDIAWDTNKREWFSLGEGTAAKPGSTYHWTGPFYRWNRTCIDCHSTDPEVNFDPTTFEYKSTYVATSIGCQSCHGGAAEHVAWQTSQNTAPDPGMPRLDATACFGCHSRRVKMLDGFGPGKAFLDHFSPELIDTDLYFPDGQIRDEVFEYGSFQQSKMAMAGVTCLDCHSAHEGTVKPVGNALCTQCHTQAPPERFAQFKPGGNFDTPAHTHHPIGSTGSRCVNCHMPQRTYMKVDPRRDHSMVIPRPELSATYGTPNGCTSCHEGKTNAWAAETMDSWYGTGWRRRPTIAHAFAGAAKSDPASIAALRALVADDKQSGIVKASAIAAMTQVARQDVAPDVKAAAGSPDPLLRLGAAKAAADLPQEQRLETVGTLLGDRYGSVRVTAITALSATPSMEFLGDSRRSFNDAVKDLRAYVDANADFAEVQTSYGLFLFGQRRAQDSEKAFEQAIALDPALSGARANLAELYRATGRNQRSEETYAEAITIAPENADLRYGHALALVRRQALSEAIDELRVAVRLAPENTRYLTTLAIALDSSGGTQEAFTLLAQAEAGGATDASLLQTGIQFGLKLRRYPETLKLAETYARVQPEDAQIADLIRQLRFATGGK